jgi:hypothetical protein
VLASTNTNSFGNNPIYLFNSGKIPEFSSGMVADFRIYNSALTASQIQQIYNDTALVSLAVAPPNTSIVEGAHQQFTATGTYRNGSIGNLTNSVKRTTAAASLTTISQGGMTTGIANGSTTG